MTKRSFDRRLFLKGFLAASGALAGTKIGIARAQALADVTVVVVGAGCAGLGAAASLKKQGAKVIVLEARDRIGGRLHTDWSMGAPFEVGAGWIHGPTSENPSKQLADAVGATYVLTDDDSAVTLYDDGEQWSDELLTEVSDYYEEILEGIDERLEVWDDRSFREVLEDYYGDVLNDVDMMWAFSAYLEFSAGAPLDDLSAATFLRTDVFPGADVVVTSGYDEMIKPLAEGLDLRLNTAVSAIRYSDDGVQIDTATGTVEGDYCICSVPLGVLKAEKIAFDPPLPSDYRDAIEELGFNSVTKIAFKFDKPFWDVETQYFGIVTEQKGRWNYWLNYRTFSDENIFLGLSVGAYAPVADAMSDEEQRQDALEVLRGVWGKEAVGEPIQMLNTHWKTDPYALGAYSYPTPGVTGSDFDDLSDPIDDRLMLCGEHTFFDHIGTTHGAYMSGLRAAEHVIDDAT